jgi:hypothetical protein
MAARLWTALLVLVGVFVMHGAQCTAAADGSGHPSPAAHTEAIAPKAALLPGDMGAAAAAITAPSDMTVGGVGEAVDAPPADRSALAALAATAAGSSPGGQHGTTGHLWTVCLAVLATGVVALVAFLLPRPALLARPTLTYAQAMLRPLPPLRPPDLSKLCLLRI